MRWEWVKKDRRFTRVNPLLAKMVGGASEICQGIYDCSPEYWPFHDNEAAGVSLLAAGAARRGCYPVAEYPVDKKTWDAVRKKWRERPSALKEKHLTRGRADLCVLDGGRYFSFEFKKTSERWDRRLGQRGLRSNLEFFHEYCVEEMDRVHDDEYHHIMGGIIAPVFPHTNEVVLREFCDEVSLALKLGSANKYKVYLLFSSLSSFG